MKTLVVYDSVYGNTEKIAQAIAGGLTGEVVLKKLASTVPADLEKIDLLIIGSPTQGGNPLKPMKAFIEGLSDSALKGVKTAAFDTRMKGTFPKLFGWAAKRISDNLKKKGANIIVEPEGFFVQSSKGPLIEGELERAASWAKQVAEAAKK